MGGGSGGVRELASEPSLDDVRKNVLIIIVNVCSSPVRVKWCFNRKSHFLPKMTPRMDGIHESYIYINIVH